MYRNNELLVQNDKEVKIDGRKPKWQKVQMKHYENYTFWIKFMKPEYITCYHGNGQSSTMLRYWTNVYDSSNKCPCTIIPERIILLDEYIFEGEPDPEIIYQ